MTWSMKRRAFGFTLGLLASLDGRLYAAEPGLPTLAPPLDGNPVLLTSDPLGTSAIGVELSVEKVQERHPNRTLKIERHVAEDAQGNYFDHGPFTRWDENGRMMGRGQYRHGKLSGNWVRWFSIEETKETYPDLLDRGFEAPFTSQAEFVDGQLHGTWSIVDAKKRQVAAWEFEHGSRHGASIWWYADGTKCREVGYRGGELDGAVRQWSTDGQATVDERYVDGYRHGVKTEYYSTGAVKSECETLFAKNVLVSADDWWNGTTEVTVVGESGRDQRHGKFVGWSKSGEKILEGAYVDDAPHGKFTWYHANGNKAIEGSYVEGKQDGDWTWWYPNGLKEIAGQYASGLERGRWRQWSDDGRVSETLSIQGLNEPLQSADVELPKVEPAQLESAPMLEAPEPPSNLQKVVFEAPLVEVSDEPQAAPSVSAKPIENTPAETKSAETGKSLVKPIVRGRK